jgi:hypothetical protein
VTTAKDDLVILTEYARSRLLERLDGLTDEEYLWEPVPACWSVRLREDGQWRVDIGEHGTAITEKTATSTPPFTTIAWRMWHLGATPAPAWPPRHASSGAEFFKAYFEQAPPSDLGVGSADEAIELVGTNWATFAADVKSWDDGELHAPMGDVAGPYGDASAYGLLLHIVDEQIHHGAEIGVVRDLYRAGFLRQ